MFLQTNYPYIKHKNSVPVHIVEEFLAEKRQKEQQKLSKGESLPPKPKAKPVIKTRKKAYVSKRHEAMKNEVVDKLLNGEYVKIADYKPRYSETALQSILLGACTDLRHKGELVAAVHSENGDRIGYVMYSALFKRFGLPDNPIYDVVEDDYQPSSEQYAIDRTTLSEKLIDGELLRVADYCLHHPRYMALKIHSAAIKNARSLHKPVASLRGIKGKKVGWVLESALDEKFNK